MSSSERHTTRIALPFRQHAAVTCPPPAELAASLAWELGDLDAERLERDLSALAATVVVEVGREPAAQLRALGEAALSARSSGSPHELMIDRVLESGHGHPVLLATVLQEIGRRASLPVAIVAGERGHYVAHQRLTEPKVLDPTTGRLVDAGPLGPMTWRCGHQVAAELLDVLQRRYERDGDLGRALKVARLRCTLPFEDSSVARQQLRRATARLN